MAARARVRETKGLVSAFNALTSVRVKKNGRKRKLPSLDNFQEKYFAAFLFLLNVLAKQQHVQYTMNAIKRFIAPDDCLSLSRD